MAAIDLTYNVSDYYTKLSEACDLLAELYWVDKAIDHLDASEETGGYGYIFKLGSSYPFERLMHNWADDFDETARAKFDTWAQEGAEWAGGVLRSLWETSLGAGVPVDGEPRLGHREPRRHTELAGARRRRRLRRPRG